MKRRHFLKGAATTGIAAGVAAAAAGAAFPTPALSQGLKQFKLVMTWPLNAPGLVAPLDLGRFPDADSWGYRLTGQLTYTNVFGGANLRPFLLWTHDVHGTTPGPRGAFIEDRKSLSAGLFVDYLKAWTARLAYTSFFGGNRYHTLIDRDSVRFSVGYSF